MTGVQNIVTSKHATYLGFPRRDSNPESALGFYRRTSFVEKLVPRELRGSLASSGAWESSGECGGVAPGACLAERMT